MISNQEASNKIFEIVDSVAKQHANSHLVRELIKTAQGFHILAQKEREEKRNKFEKASREYHSLKEKF